MSEAQLNRVRRHLRKLSLSDKALIRDELTAELDGKAIDRRTYNDGYADGWNFLLHIVETHYDPMMKEWQEVEVVTAYIYSIVIHNPHDLSKTKKPLREFAEQLGDKLNRLDIIGRELMTAVGDNGPAIDTSGPIALRDAIIDYTSGADRTGKKLRELHQQQQPNATKSHTDIMRHLKSRRKEKEPHTIFLCRRIHEKVSTGMTVSQAAKDAVKELKEERGQHCSWESARSYYYKYRNDLSLVAGN